MEQVNNMLLELIQSAAQSTAPVRPQQGGAEESGSFQKLMEQHSQQAPGTDEKAGQAQQGALKNDAPAQIQPAEPGAAAVQEQMVWAAAAMLSNPVVPMQQAQAVPTVMYWERSPIYSLMICHSFRSGCGIVQRDQPQPQLLEKVLCMPRLLALLLFLLPAVLRAAVRIAAVLVLAFLLALHLDLHLSVRPAAGQKALKAGRVPFEQLARLRAFSAQHDVQAAVGMMGQFDGDRAQRLRLQPDLNAGLALLQRPADPCVNLRFDAFGLRLRLTDLDRHRFDVAEERLRLPRRAAEARCDFSPGHLLALCRRLPVSGLGLRLRRPADSSLRLRRLRLPRRLADSGV